MKSQKGQLALGLAFGFSTILVIFVLVFKSSYLVREKIELQQATDFSALQAAAAQKDLLDRIKTFNDWIEAEFIALGVALSIPHCNVAAAVSCGACNPIIEAYRQGLIQKYSSIRKIEAEFVSQMLQRGNSWAYRIALRAFLQFPLLTSGLKRFVKLFGPHPTPEQLVEEYDRGGLEKHLHLSSPQLQLPLFHSQTALRPLPFTRWDYPPGSILNCVPVPTAAVTPPLPVKIIQASPYRTSFLLTAVYTPVPFDTLSDPKKMNLPFRDSYGEKDTNVAGDELSIIPDQRPAEFQVPMIAMSLAKPYGGTFPTSDLPSRSFKGVKLAGIADKNEVGGVDLLGKIKLALFDFQSRWVGDVEIQSKEFLH